MCVCGKSAVTIDFSWVFSCQEFPTHLLREESCSFKIIKKQTNK